MDVFWDIELELISLSWSSAVAQQYVRRVELDKDATLPTDDEIEISSDNPNEAIAPALRRRA